jgi:hypothetical protein
MATCEEIAVARIASPGCADEQLVNSVFVSTSEEISEQRTAQPATDSERANVDEKRELIIVRVVDFLGGDERETAAQTSPVVAVQIQ